MSILDLVGIQKRYEPVNIPLRFEFGFKKIVFIGQVQVQRFLKNVVQVQFRFIVAKCRRLELSLGSNLNGSNLVQLRFGFINSNINLIFASIRSNVACFVAISTIFVYVALCLFLCLASITEFHNKSSWLEKCKENKLN